MREVLKKRENIRAIIVLGIFFFVFLGTEYLFDNNMAQLTDSSGVVWAQSYILFASALGFIAYSAIFKFVNIRKISSSTLNIICILCTVPAIVSFIIINIHSTYGQTLFFGIVLFFIMGIAGAHIHYYVAFSVTDRVFLARIVGISYAFGILLQFINNNLVKKDVAEMIVLVVFMLIGITLIITGKKQDALELEKDTCDDSQGNDENSLVKYKRNRAVLLIAAVALMTLIFAALDNTVTMVHAGGGTDIGQWPRLLLAISGLLAGFIYDISERKYMNIIMYCVTVLSTICIVVIWFGGPFLAGLIVFYLSAGFFSVFFMTGFMELSYDMGNPRLWAGLGRAINNLCAIVITYISGFYNNENLYMAIIFALVLFAAISVIIFISENNMRNMRLAADECVATAINDIDSNDNSVPKDLFPVFANEYKLTDREQEVMLALMSSDDNVQDIAKQLGISRAALYRHISNMNEKTSTKARIGLLQFYYAWKPQK